jgi:hypothetical protein
MIVKIAPSDEPNNSCSQAFPISFDRTYQFLANDKFDWYVLDLNVSGSVGLEVRLTNFVPQQGQIVIYKGSTCDTAVLKGQNGDTATTKVITLPNQTSGRYYVGIANDGTLNDVDLYNLRVSIQP